MTARRWLPTLALGGVAAIVAFGLAEVLVRAARLQVNDWGYNARKYARLVHWDERGFTLQRPHAATYVYGTTMRFNALGMRDVEHGPKAPGRRRVLVLGDSNVVGLGVDLEDVFFRRLEAALNDTGAGPFEVVAAAVAGWNTVAERNFLATEGFGLQPDVVVLLYVDNDNARDLPWGARSAQGLPMRAWQWLTDHSRAVELATWAYRRRYPRPADPASLRAVNEMMRARAERAAEPHRFEPDDPGWRESRAALEDVASMTRKAGIPFVVFVLNFGNPEMQTLLDGLGDFGRRTATPVVDTRPWFGTREPTKLLNSSLHPNAEGHAILAGGMARTLAELGLSASPRARTAPLPRAGAGSPPSPP